MKWAIFDKKFFICNVVSFKRYTLDSTFLQFCDSFQILGFVVVLKNGHCLSGNSIVCAKFRFAAAFLQVLEQYIASGGKVQRINWMWEQLLVQYNYLRHKVVKRLWNGSITLHNIRYWFSFFCERNWLRACIPKRSCLFLISSI